MKTPRVGFVSVLDHAKPALSGKNLIDELAHYWFDGTFLSAYNDVIGIRVPLETDFQGGVRGVLLSGILDKSRARDVTLTSGADDSLDIRAGNAKAHLALLLAERQIWKPSELNWNNSFGIDGAFIHAIELALLSTGTQKLMRPEQRGLSFIPSDGVLDIYSTDEKSISWARIEQPKDYPDVQVILPTEFCEQIVKLGGADDLIHIDESSVWLKTKEGILVFSRLVETPKIIDFADVLTNNLKVGNGASMVAVPSRLGLALDRASIVLDSGQPAEFAIEENHLYISAKSALGEIEDIIKLGEPSHGDIAVNLDPSLVSRALNNREEVVIEKNCIIFRGPKNFYHVIATI